MIESTVPMPELSCSPAIAIEPFGADDLPAALALSQAENWPHRAEDWRQHLAMSHGVVARVGGRVVGTACGTPFGAVAMLNLIIVSGTMRGRGLGRRLVQEVMAKTALREYRLVATEAGMPLYRKLGFRETGRIEQFQGFLAAADMPLAQFAGPADAESIAALDRAVTGMDRKALITSLLANGQVTVLRTGAGIAGYAGRRTFGRGQLIGPVIAPDVGAARRLMAGLFAGCAGQFMRVDMVEGCGLSGWLKDLGLARIDSGTVMSLGPTATDASDATAPCYFALASQALG